MNRPLNTQERLEARFAYKVAAGLHEAADNTPHDINERLKVARLQALEAARAARKLSAEQTAQSVNVSANGANSSSASATLSGGPSSRNGGWVSRMIYIVPAAALAIAFWAAMNNSSAPMSPELSALAEIDAEVLADELPPIAFLESGFAAFAKNEVKVD